MHEFFFIFIYTSFGMKRENMKETEINLLTKESAQVSKEAGGRKLFYS